MSSKLPIPRLQHESRESSGRRISRACNNCRERKTKCDGKQPRCSQCLSQGLTNCFVPEGKLIRLQKQLESERRKNEGYEELLRNISLEIEEPIANRVRKALKGSSHATGARHQRKRSNASSSSSLGSLEDNDVASEDFNRDEQSRATGYMGKNSEIVWMQRLESEATRQSSDEDSAHTPLHQGSMNESIASMNYHLDDRNLSEANVTNAFVLPPRALSDRLFQVYLDKVQISLPFIRQDLFREQYHRCYLTSTVNPGRKWLAIFNLILAIGCAFSRLAEQNIHNADENLFFTRARSLSVPENILYEHDDLQQVQFEALMAFFFLAISQINRSWKMIGIAARSAISLGINLQKKKDGTDEISEEARKQLWWSIFRLEHLLSVMTGRVSCLGSASSSLSPPTPLPSPAHAESDSHQTNNETPTQVQNLQWTIHTDQRKMDSQRSLLRSITPSSSLYHFYMADLSLISHAISSGVYATGSHRKDWARIESRIFLYSEKMDNWVSVLHPSFCFEDSRGNLLPSIESPMQVSLALTYYSTRIILNRPCLNRPALERKSGLRVARSRISNLSALACLQASMAVIALLPDQASLDWCYELHQWWEFVRIITQATTILLLDIFIGPVPTKPEEVAVASESVDAVLNGAKKGLLWLRCLGKTSGAARRSFEFGHSCLRRVAARRNFDLSDIPPPTSPQQSYQSVTETHETSPTLESELFPVAETPNPTESHQHEYGSSDIDIRDPQEIQYPAETQNETFSVYDADIDMSDFNSHLENSEFEELLLAVMGP